MSRVMNAVPFRTISITVFHAFGDNLSVGDTKFPAALLMIISGRPHSFSQKSTAAATWLGSRTSAATGKTYKLKPVSLQLKRKTYTRGWFDKRNLWCLIYCFRGWWIVLKKSCVLQHFTQISQVSPIHLISLFFTWGEGCKRGVGQSGRSLLKPLQQLVPTWCHTQIIILMT